MRFKLCFVMGGVFALLCGQAAATTASDEEVFRQCPSVKVASDRAVAVSKQGAASTNAISNPVEKMIASCKAGKAAKLLLNELLAQIKACQSAAGTPAARTMTLETQQASAVITTIQEQFCPD